MYVVVNGIKKFAKVPRLLAENYCTDADRMHTGNKQTSIPIVCHNRLDLVDRHSKIVFYLCIISLVDVWQNIFSHSSVVFFIQILHFYDRSIVCDTHCWWGFSSITIHFIFSVKDQNNWKKMCFSCYELKAVPESNLNGSAFVRNTHTTSMNFWKNRLLHEKCITQAWVILTI